MKMGETEKERAERLFQESNQINKLMTGRDLTEMSTEEKIIDVKITDKFDEMTALFKNYEPKRRFVMICSLMLLLMLPMHIETRRSCLRVLTQKIETIDKKANQVEIFTEEIKK